MTVATVVHDDGRYLLVEEEIRGNQVFNQPAGHLEPDESLIDGAIRETLEETGHTVEIIGLLGIYQWKNAHNDKQFVRVTFGARSIAYDEHAQLDEGIVRCLWLSRPEIEQQNGRLRSPMVLRNIDDFENGRLHPVELIQYVGTE